MAKYAYKSRKQYLFEINSKFWLPTKYFHSKTVAELENFIIHILISFFEQKNTCTVKNHFLRHSRANARRRRKMLRHVYRYQCHPPVQLLLFLIIRFHHYKYFAVASHSAHVQTFLNSLHFLVCGFLSFSHIRLLKAYYIKYN